MAVIPQIILAGVIAPLDGLSKVLALSGITTYWGKRGLDGCLPEKVAQAVRLEQNSTTAAVFVLLAHAAAGVIAALLLLHLSTMRRKLTRLLR
jgi:hypothetical protein